MEELNRTAKNRFWFKECNRTGYYPLLRQQAKKEYRNLGEEDKLK